MTTDTRTTLDDALADWHKAQRAYANGLLNGVDPEERLRLLGDLGDADDVLAAAYDAHVADQQPQAKDDSEVESAHAAYPLMRDSYRRMRDERDQFSRDLADLRHQQGLAVDQLASWVGYCNALRAEVQRIADDIHDHWQGIRYSDFGKSLRRYRDRLYAALAGTTTSQQYGSEGSS